MQLLQEKCVEHKFYVPLGPLEKENLEKDGTDDKELGEEKGLSKKEREDVKEVITTFVKKYLGGATIYSGHGLTKQYGDEETTVVEVLVPIHKNSGFRIEQLRYLILATLNVMKKRKGFKPEEDILHTSKIVEGDVLGQNQDNPLAIQNNMTVEDGEVQHG